MLCFFFQRQQVKPQVSLQLKDIFDVILFYIQRQQPQVERRVSIIPTKHSEYILFFSLATTSQTASKSYIGHYG